MLTCSILRRFMQKKSMNLVEGCCEKVLRPGEYTTAVYYTLYETIVRVWSCPKRQYLFSHKRIIILFYFAHYDIGCCVLTYDTEQQV